MAESEGPDGADKDWELSSSDSDSSDYGLEKTGPKSTYSIFKGFHSPGSYKTRPSKPENSSNQCTEKNDSTEELDKSKSEEVSQNIPQNDNACDSVSAEDMDANDKIPINTYNLENSSDQCIKNNESTEQTVQELEPPKITNPNSKDVSDGIQQDLKTCDDVSSENMDASDTIPVNTPNLDNNPYRCTEKNESTAEVVQELEQTEVMNAKSDDINNDLPQDVKASDKELTRDNDTSGSISIDNCDNISTENLETCNIIPIITDTANKTSESYSSSSAAESVNSSVNLVDYSVISSSEVKEGRDSLIGENADESLTKKREPEKNSAEESSGFAEDSAELQYSSEDNNTEKTEESEMYSSESGEEYHECTEKSADSDQSVEHGIENTAQPQDKTDYEDNNSRKSFAEKMSVFQLSGDKTEKSDKKSTKPHVKETVLQRDIAENNDLNDNSIQLLGSDSKSSLVEEHKNAEGDHTCLEQERNGHKNHKEPQKSVENEKEIDDDTEPPPTGPKSLAVREIQSLVLQDAANDSNSNSHVPVDKPQETDRKISKASNNETERDHKIEPPPTGPKSLAVKEVQYSMLNLELESASLALVDDSQDEIETIGAKGLLNVTGDNSEQKSNTVITNSEGATGKNPEEANQTLLPNSAQYTKLMTSTPFQYYPYGMYGMFGPPHAPMINPMVMSQGANQQPKHQAATAASPCSGPTVSSQNFEEHGGKKQGKHRDFQHVKTKDTKSSAKTPKGHKSGVDLDISAKSENKSQTTGKEKTDVLSTNRHSLGNIRQVDRHQHETHRKSSVLTTEGSKPTDRQFKRSTTKGTTHDMQKSASGVSPKPHGRASDTSNKPKGPPQSQKRNKANQDGNVVLGDKQRKSRHVKSDGQNIHSQRADCKFILKTV